jgi:hypothetical protein
MILQQNAYVYISMLIPLQSSNSLLVQYLQLFYFECKRLEGMSLCDVVL